MSKQTINIGASPNDGTGTPLRTSFDYTNQNFTEIYTALGGGVALPGATTQVIFNDGGTNLAGDAGLVYNKTTDALTVAGPVNAASATITGALGAAGLNVTGATIPANGVYLGSANNLSFSAASTLGMTLNSTGLGVGVVPSYAFQVKKTLSGTSTTVNGLLYIENNGSGNSAKITLTDGISNNGYIVYSNETGNALLGLGVGSAQQLVVNSSGNVGVGVTPSAWATTTTIWRALDMQYSCGLASSGAGSGEIDLLWNAYYDQTDQRWEFKYTGDRASRYSIGGAGVHAWYNTASTGTANNPITWTQAMVLDASGNLLVGLTSGSFNRIKKDSAADLGNAIFEIVGASNATSSIHYSVSSYNANAANAASKFGRDATTLRSINAGGTVNVAGADYAEYMVKCSDFILSKGDVAGIDANGKLTNVFADAVSFVVKSTDPSYVGNDKWGIDLEGDDLESARQLVDRIAFAGQVPVNVTGAKAGDYIVPVVNGTGIKGISISKPTFDQYQLAVGKVIAIDADGRARIIVKVA